MTYISFLTQLIFQVKYGQVFPLKIGVMAIPEPVISQFFLITCLNAFIFR